MSRTLHLTPAVADRIRGEIAAAGGNEVCFLARVGAGGGLEDALAVARGNATAVLAAAREAEPGMVVLHNHPSGDLDPSDADLRVAARLHGEGLGLAITDNEASRLYVVVEPPRPAPVEPLDGAAIAAILAPGGAVAASHPAYEDRPTQRDMAVRVAAAYTEGRIALAEAGTGTGKSVAYLIPATLWAVRNRRRTVVSTNTINLQEQLVGKDLPLVKRALGEPFRYALVKGRGNYVSIRRAKLAAATSGSLFDAPEAAELDAILAWLEATNDGSLQDLAFTPAAEVWDEVASESDVCLRTRCPHFEQCFYQRARRNAAAADVLVVNHALLFSDLAVRRAQDNYTAAAVLPPYRHVVLDEAHNLEDAATAHLGARVTRRGLFRLLGRLERRGKGLLPSLDARLAALAEGAVVDAAAGRLASLRPAVEQARENAVVFFDHIAALAARAEDGVVRLPVGFAAEPGWTEGPEPSFQSLVLALDALAAGLRGLHQLLAGDEELGQRLEEALLELEAAGSRTETAAASLRLVFSPAEGPVPMVRWIERRPATDGRETGMSAHAAPIDLSDALRDALFERIDSAVLTSATLTTRDGFEFLRRRLGLAGGGIKVEEGVHPSPFDFESNALLLIPTDLPLPDRGRAERGDPPARPLPPHEHLAAEGRAPASERLARAAAALASVTGVASGGRSSYDAATAMVVEDLAAASDGGIFVLFTSYRALRAVAAMLRRSGAHGRWPLFVQGEAQRAKLVEAFAASGRGILLGVASFWEGVDVAGHALRGLLIPKLPFKVPGEPLTAARLEALEAQGGSGFREYLLPHAALRLKQGFGRLIRTRTDRGAIVLLDRRVLEKGYGRYFLESLPPAPVRTGPWPELAAALRDFYAAPASRVLA